MTEMIKNDVFKAMREENAKTTLFDGVAIMKDEDDGQTVIYHEVCDTDIWLFTERDVDFSDVLETVLVHLGECEPKEDTSDPWGDILDDEEIESL